MPDTALVLGGGGVTGVAWELGLLTGLAESGVDLTTADLVVGTSAGSVVGALVASGVDLEQRYQRQLAAHSGEIAARMDWRVLARFGWAMLRARDAADYAGRVGRFALDAKTVSEEERREVMRQRLGVSEWPERPLLITAVDAETGEFRAFDRESGVSILDAVGASCAVPGVWPPVTIDGRRFIDGGVRSATNADLAKGCKRVAVIAPILLGGRHTPSVGRQAGELREAGAEVAVISPDQAARQAIGRNVLDPARRAAAAKAGRAQARTVVDQVAAVFPAR
jgi:NTE family protein